MRVTSGFRAGLVILLALLLPGCAQLAQLAPTGRPVPPAEGAKDASAARRVTILYTGYGRGTVDPYASCT